MGSSQIQSDVSWIKHSQFQSEVPWIKHYKEERLYFSPAVFVEPFRIYTRDGFSVSVPAPIMMAFSSLAKRLMTGGGGQDIFLPSVKGRTVLLLVELLRSGITKKIGPEESIKDVQDLMQLLEIYGRIDVVRIDKGNSVLDKRHIQRAPLDHNISKSKLEDRNGHGMSEKSDLSNLMASRDTDGDREFTNCCDNEYGQSTPTRYDNSLDKKIEDGNGNFMLDKPDFSNVLMVSSDTDDSYDEHFQSARMSLDNAMAMTAGNGKGSNHALNKPESSNILVLPSIINEGRDYRNVSDKKLLLRKSSSHNKSSMDGCFEDMKGICALDKPKIPNINVVSSNVRNLGSNINIGKISTHIGQKNRFRNFSKFRHEMYSESKPRNRFWPKTILHCGFKKNLRKMSPMRIEEEKSDSKFKCKSDIKVAASKFTMKRSCDEVFEAIEVSDDCDNVSTNEDMNNNASKEVILENVKNGSKALVEGQERLEGPIVKEGSVEENIPEPQIEFLALFNLCTHAHAEQIRARMAIKPTTSRLKRSRAKKNK